jgi:hypothetical protein
MRSIRLALAFAAVVAVVGACGGSSGSAAPKATAADAGSQPAPSAATKGGGSDDSGAGDGSSGGDASIPKIGDATYKSGTANVKITGEKSLDLTGKIAEGGALTIGGTTVLQYALPSDGGFIQISFLQDDSSSGSGIAVTDGDFVTSGAWGEDCDVTLSRNDGSGIAGDFRCKGLTGADTKLAKAYKIDMEGSFQADR